MCDLIDLHTHTLACGHAYNTLYEMIRAAACKGIGLFGSSDHGPCLPGSCGELYFSNFKVIPRQQSGIRVLMGCELNIIDYEGSVDLKEITQSRLDYGIASLHVPCCAPGSVAENTNAYLGVMKNPYVQIIGHPDDGRYPVDYDTLVAAAAQHHKLLEVNSSSLHPLSPRKGARERYLDMLGLCVRYQTPIIIGSDAHCEADVGNHQRALALLEEIGFPQDLIVNTHVEKLIPYIPALKDRKENEEPSQP